MFDRPATALIRPTIERLARSIAASGLKPDAVTVAALGTGLVAALLIANGVFLVGLAAILASRLLDGLDGAVARVSGRVSHLGGFLDITFDFVFYGSIPLAFAVFDPAANALAASVLLLTFYANGGSVLAFAVMAEQRGIGETERAGKSLMFTSGLMEGGETLAFFVLFCLFPGWFAPLALVFAGLTAITFSARVALAIRTFGDG